MFSWSLVDIMTRTNKNRTNVMMARHISELPGTEHKLIEINGYICTFERDIPVLYFQDQVFGTKLVVDYVTDLFSLDIYGLTTFRNGLWAFDWINNRQEKLLDSLGLSKNPSYVLNKDKTVDNVLIRLPCIVYRNALSSDSVSINVNVSHNVRFNGKLGPVDVNLFDSNAHWVTCDYLMNCNAIKLFVSFSRISELDLNSFLRHWRAGGSPRLAYLKVFFASLDTYIENFDQDLEIVKTNEVRRFRVVAEEDVEEILEDYSIQRQDGVKATISCEFGYFTMIVWHVDGNRL
ncbi:hypothetical protein B9Z55_002589 [Caenorhabditis nigoni]|nr:hypothetical protein B9Z55_002589 [Caenorhabditis nigoni]